MKNHINKWKRIAIKLLFLPVWMIMLLTAASAIGLVAIFMKGLETHPLSCAFYVVAFYTLTVICVMCRKTLPRYYRSINGRLHRNKYTDRYLTDVAFRTKVGLYSSLAINLIYAAVNAISAIIYNTYWFAIFAGYYGIIAIMRFLLVRYVGKNSIGDNYYAELKRARICAAILLTVNLALSGAVLMMSYFGRGFQYQGVLIYVIALYTFYITVTAIVDMIKYRKYNSPVMSVTKIIKTASALFSMLFLETAMFAQFGADTPPQTRRIMIMATGAGISVAVVTMAFHMIIHTSREIRHYNSGSVVNKH